ncbi:MAG: hypothetical protein ACYC8T_33925 [Myxococcaceae bacterium]
MSPGGREPFWPYLGLAGGVAVVGVAVAGFGPWGPDRAGALVGTLAAALSVAVALPLKRRAVRKSMNAALLAMAAVFGFRVVLLAAGLLWVLSKGTGAMAFTLGFFGVYLVLQWLEISYVMAERKRLGPGV